jgi:hypothetical protein
MLSRHFASRRQDVAMQNDQYMSENEQLDLTTSDELG